MSTGDERRDRVMAGACIECGGELSAGCPRCGGTGLEPQEMRWFFLSFADPHRPQGEQFLGGCYVEAESLPLAVATTHALGINPGGEAKILDIPPEARVEFEASVPPELRNRLLTRAEIEGSA